VKHCLVTGLFLMSALLFAACDQKPEMPQSMRQAIAGDWKQANGGASLRFYADTTVMVRLPNRNPPLNFLSSYDLLKDGRISIDTGDVWHDPITCAWEKGSKVMQVTLPEKKAAILKLTKQ